MQDNTSFEHFSLYSTAPGSKSSQITLSDSLRPHLKQSKDCVFSETKKNRKVNTYVSLSLISWTIFDGPILLYVNLLVCTVRIYFVCKYVILLTNQVEEKNKVGYGKCSCSP